MSTTATGGSAVNEVAGADQHPPTTLSHYKRTAAAALATADFPPFAHRGALASDQEDPAKYLTLFAAFLRDTAAGASGDGLAEVADMLEQLTGGPDDDSDASNSQPAGSPSAAPAARPTARLRSHPEYGCAVLALSSIGCRGERTVRLHVIGLDQWAFGTAAGRFGSTPPPGSSVDLFAGDVPESKAEAVFEAFDDLLAKAKQLKKDKRSAASGQQGHQKTPTFILAVLRDAVQGHKKPTNPSRGGMTDVGLHTGGHARSTAWPLAACVIRYAVESHVAAATAGRCGSDPCDWTQQDDTISFEELLPAWELWLAEVSLHDCARIGPEETHRMLDSAARRGAVLADKGVGLPSSFVARATKVQSALHDGLATRLRKQAAQFVLPKLNLDRDDAGDVIGIDGVRHRLPQLTLPPPPAHQLAECDVPLSRKRAVKNLRGQPLPPSALAPVDDLVAWLETTALDMDHVRVAGIEEWVFKSAVSLLPKGSPPPMSGQQLEEVNTVSETYRESVSALVTSEATVGGRMLVVIHSRETLAAWAIACLVDRAACQAHPQLARYEMALDYADLRWLSLSDGQAHEALQAVTEYIRRRKSDASTAAPVFSMRSNDATPAFAESVSRESPSVMQDWADEQKHAGGRRDAHWAEVQRKQRLAKALRARLADETQVYNAASRAHQDAEPGSTGRYASQRERENYYAEQRLMERSNKHQRRVEATQRELQEAVKAPQHVTQPLPENESTALGILFFMRMPQPLRLLSDLVFTAQEALLPRLLSRAKVGDRRFDWVQHHRDHQQWQYSPAVRSDYSPAPPVPAGRQGKVALRSTISAPSTFGPDRVDSCTDPSEGVWHPAGPLLMWWKGGIDPFALPSRQDMLEFYTEQLGAAALQFAMPVDDRPRTSSTRGNVAVAQQRDRPPWLTRPQFLVFGNLRAFPRLQIRKICCALRDRALPFADRNVQTLVKQAMYQVGELDGVDGQPTQMAWKHDDMVSGRCVPALAAALASFADELEDRISEHGELLAVIDVCVYLLGFHPADDTLRAVRGRCVEITRRWCYVRNREIEASTTDPADVPQLRADQCIFNMYGILALGGTDVLDANSIGSLCELMCQAHSGFVFMVSSADKRHVLPHEDGENFARLRERCEFVASLRVAAVCAAAKTDGTILTRAVGNVLPHTPAALDWVPLADGTNDRSLGCFEAVSEAPDTHLYSVNVLTGAVLLDGSPPRSLPYDILSHPLYQRTFEKRDFEVSLTDAGALLTIRRLNGYTYEFVLHGDALHIVEHSSAPAEPSRLELLDGVTPTEWGADLPVRLREHYAHWLDRDTNTIYMRPPRPPARSIAFVVLCDGSNGVHCYRVPVQMTDFSASRLGADAREGKLPDVLVTWQDGDHLCPPVTALSKFERLEFVHYFRQQRPGRRDGYRIELPRFNLEFEMTGDNQLRSINFKGYHLAANPQLPDSLLGFIEYLIITPDVCTPEAPWTKTPHKVIVPSGTVLLSSDASDARITIQGEDGSCATRKYAVHAVHGRFGELRAASIASRLQLAALYAAADTSGIPEPRAGMSGTELAISLVRRCFVNRPLSPSERDGVHSVAGFARDVPALFLICEHLVATAEQLGFLYSDPPTEPPELGEVGASADYKTAYMAYAQAGRCNPRRMLTAEEELRVLGRRAPAAPRPARVLRRTTAPVLQLQDPPVAADYVSSAADRLKALVVTSLPPPPRPFPMQASGSGPADELGRDMMAELEDSWETQEKLLPTQISIESICDPVLLRAGDAVALLAFFQLELAQARVHRESMERYVGRAAAANPHAAAHDYTWHAAAYQLYRAAGRVPVATMPELARSLWEQSSGDRNLFLSLSKADSDTFRGALVLWMELCVLETKMERLVRMALALHMQKLKAEQEAKEQALAEERDGTTTVKTTTDVDSDTVMADIQAELLVTRTWPAAQHPQWLALEVDSEIQIRPAQFKIVKEAIDTPGSVMQLNMGLGKTRVIVPMLLLHWRSGNQAVRLNFLSELLPEAHAFLHHQLSANSMLEIKLFQIPFHRDVVVTEDRLHVMLEHVDFCRRVGGALFMTPEARCSLHLKQHEMREARCEPERRLVAALDETPCFDIFDESDALLRVKFQLIYATGESSPLPSLDERCTAVRVVLQALQQCPDVSRTLQNRRIAVVDDAAPGTFFAGLRLLPGADTDAAMPDLSAAVAGFIIDHAGDDDNLRWIAKWCDSPEKRANVVTFITDTAVDADGAINPALFEVSPRRRAMLLALRGLLAHGVLWHCLQKRWRVDYGVMKPCPARRKRLAIPFRAADTPAERAEFAHIDLMLMLTTLSYTFSGLSKPELHEAFTALNALNPNDRTERYRSWIADVKEGCLAGDDTESISAACKLDLTNVLQLKLLHATFRKSRLVVHFWLEAVVFPAETVQYSHRLKSTAWHLRQAAGGTCVGFSGTNDQHRLLPLHMKQHPLPDPELEATNGHMLAMLLERARYRQLEVPPGTQRWKALLKFAVDQKASALIDAGALLAGVDLAEVGRTLLATDKTQSAVVFYDRPTSAWVLLDNQGCQWPLKLSPVQERDAFVIFDEQHCRGSDMRLKPDARAVLTLGPHMTKDKLMQAAGRLRKLRTQSLVLTALPDIHDQIGFGRAPSPSSPGGCGTDPGHSTTAPGSDLDTTSLLMNPVLDWVMRNTIAASRSGLHEWAVSGTHFFSTFQAPDRVRQEEILELDRMYGAAATPCDLGKLISDHVQARDDRTDMDQYGQGGLTAAVRASRHASDPANVASYAKRIEERGRRYGRGTQIDLSALDEECERELELEKETEKEIEKQLPRQKPNKETEWDVRPEHFSDLKTLQRHAPGDLIPLQAMFPSKAIDWGPGIWLTPNFHNTVADTAATTFSMFSQDVDVMVQLDGNSVVLLSNREADALLESERQERSAATKGSQLPESVLLHKSCACGEGTRLSDQRPHVPLEDGTLARVQLFSGETMFGTAARRGVIADLLQTRAAADDARKLPAMRGLERFFTKSDLARACDPD